jgi:hypothetical protein
LSCCPSTWGRKPSRLWAGPCSSAYVLQAESCLGICRRSSSKACPLACMLVSAARSRSDHRLCLPVLERTCSALLESPLSLLKYGSPSLESSSSSLLDGLTVSDAGAPTSTKQLAPPLVQERPAHLHIVGSLYYLLNFVEQRTRMVPMLW